MNQFNRRASVTIETKEDWLVIEGLRISFDVEKANQQGGVLNRFNIQIYNLSKAHRDMIEDVGRKVYLNVGYNNPGHLLTRLAEGHSIIVKNSYEGPETVTKIEVMDGINVVNQSATMSAASGEKMYEVLKKMAKEAKLEIDFRGASLDTIKDKIFNCGYAFADKLRHGFDEITNSLDCDWNIDGNKLVLYEREGGTPGSVLLLTENTGLVGVPEKIDDITRKSGKVSKKNSGQVAKTPGYNVTCLLNPTIKPGVTIHVHSLKQRMDGEFLVYAVTHHGDTHGQEWQSVCRVASKK